MVPVRRDIALSSRVRQPKHVYGCMNDDATVTLQNPDDTVMTKKKLNPLHPGEVLLEEFLKPMDLSQNRLAIDIGVPPRRINEIVLGKRRITADTALRLARYFDMSPQFWLGLQMDYDLDVTEDILAERLAKEARSYTLTIK